MQPRRGREGTACVWLFLAANVVLFTAQLAWLGRRAASGSPAAPPLTPARGDAASDDAFASALVADRAGLSRRAKMLEAQAAELQRRLDAATEDTRRCRFLLSQRAAPQPTEGPPPTAAPPPSTAPLQPQEQEPWLLIGMPSVPRGKESAATPLTETLLYRTLASIARQVEASTVFGAGLVRVVVANQRPGAHPVFDKCRAHFAAARWIEFLENTDPLPDAPHPFSPEFADSTKEQPTPRVRRQSLDVVRLLERCEGRSRYFLFYEDDFEFCDNALMALHYMVTRADEYQGAGRWAALRCGFGLSGIVMHNRAPADVAVFRAYLHEHFNRRPPDHLVVEFFAKESQQGAAHFGPSRHVMAFRYNILRHLGGAQSTLREEAAWSFPGCFTELIAPQVFPVEAWNPVDCPQDDVWPCAYAHGPGGPGTPSNVRPTALVWNNSTAAHVSNSRVIYVKDEDGDDEAPRHGRRGKKQKKKKRDGYAGDGNEEENPQG